MKTNHQLLFNPITFETISCNGSTGSMGHNKNYLRSALSQNIVYAVYREALTVNQIADTLGVSPVYVESEVAFLTENCFLLQKGQTYLSNCLIDEPTNELRRLHDELYTQAAALLAPELFDTLNANVQLGQNGIICPRNNLNFALWALIPYVLARGDAEAIPHTISFDEVATMRPDGGHNICGCSVLSPNVEPPLYWESLKRMGGPSWNGNAELLLWLIDTEWSERRIDYGTMMQQDYLLLKRFFADGELSCDETTHLVSRGYLKHEPVANGYCNSMQIVWIKGQEANQRILGYGSAIKDKHRNALNKLATPFVNAILDETPPHLRKMQAYGLQHILHSDGWFIMHCLKYLVGAGKLKLPIDDERRSLTAVVVTEK